jgi:cupin fold WbuC family metalloprotein
MKLGTENFDLINSNREICLFGCSDVNSLKELAYKSPLKRARFCAHHSSDDLIHEMLITLHKDTYIQPHRHSFKSESFQVIEGEAEVLIFTDNGKVKQRIMLSSYDQDGCFYYRLNECSYHTVIVKSEFFVFLETTNGPFNKASSEYASWAPTEDASKYKIKSYLKSL